MNQLSRIEQYLNDPDQMARFRTELLTALYDPDYATPRNIFDWTRFACEFTAPDFDPPLDSMSFFSFLVQPHFAQTWHILPRTRAWWLLRLGEDVTEPVIWLHQQQLQGGRENMTRIAERLNHPAITRQGLSSFLHRFKYPPIPDSFLTDNGQRILVLSGSDPAAAWGVESEIFRQKLIWKVVLCEPVTPLVNNYDFATLKQPHPSLRSAVADILDKQKFQPGQILFYSNFFLTRQTGQIIRHDPHLESISSEPSTWPQLVERWDEDGWPVGQRVWRDGDGIPHPFGGDA